MKKEFLTTTYAYDKNGNVTKIVTPEGYEITREYDLLDRKKKETHVDKTSGIERTTEHRYDKAGNLVEEIDSRGSIRRCYDLQDQMTEEVDREGNQTKYDLDAWGRITTIHKPDGSKENYEYDYAGNITAATDGNGNTIQYHFNSMNKLEEIVDQNGERETFTYDNR